MKINLERKINKIVVKVGSSILSAKSNQLDKHRLESITAQICQLKKENIGVVLVSSGAIASGMQLLNLKQRPKNLTELQAAAAIGQSRLMHNYERFFGRFKFLTAQILLTADDFNDRTRYLNARNTILNLLEKDVVAVVNENDTVATDEIKLGDNDRLSALVASLIDAELLIILSDIDGFYDQNKQVIEKVNEIDSLVRSLAKDTAKQTSVGGMITKLEAAKIATNAGIAMVIANGRRDDILLKIIQGQKVGTWFLPKKEKLLAKKHWLAFSCRSCGKIFVDEGAKDALLKKGRSLLSSGITNLEGKFSAGDLVLVCDEKNNEIARGISSYSSAELSKIKGVKTSQIKEKLGYKHSDEVIHRNNLVIVT